MLVEYRGTFYRLLHPRPTVIVVSKCPGGKTNMMPASWNTPVSEEPPTIAVAVDKSTYTWTCLEHLPEATINVPSIDDVDLIYRLGSMSGRDVDKTTELGVELAPSERVSVPHMARAIAVYEVRVHSKVDVGEVTLYVFEVLRTLARNGLADEWGIDLSKANIPLHGAGRVFHRVDQRKVYAQKRQRYATG